MIVRPSYIYWMHPDSENGWFPVPQSVRDRCNHQQVDANLVHWHDANTKPSTKEVADQITKALAEVTEAKGWDIGLSVLFVWNGVNSRPGFLDECLTRTKEFLSVFRQAIDANIGQYQQLGNSRFEILIKLPRTGFVFDEQENQRKTQKQWLDKMKKHINPPDNLFVPLSRVWLLGNNNINNQHRSGITIATDVEHELLAAEVISFWLDSDLDSIIDDAQIATEPYLSIGIGRLIFETEKCTSSLSKRMSIRLLKELLKEDSRNPNPEEIEAFLSHLPLTSDIRGIDAKTVSELFLNPRKIISSSQDTTISDLGGQILFNFEIDPSDINDIEKSLNLPASLMLQGQMLISRRIFEGMKRVRECRHRTYNEIVKQFKSEIHRLTRTAEDTHLTGLSNRILMWKKWISEQSKLAKVTVSKLMRSDSSSSNPVEEQLNALFQNISASQDLVSEDKPDPKIYADRLSSLLSKRALAEAFILRSIVGAVGCTWALFHFLSLFSSPFSIWIFSLPGRILISLMLPLTWGIMTYLKLMKQKKRRENALNALMISIIKNGKWLLREFISREINTIYSNSAVYVGSEQDLVDYKSLNTELKSIASRKSCRSSEISAILTHTLLARVGKLRSTIQKALSTLENDTDPQGIQDSKWVTNLSSCSIADKLPFLVKPVSEVSIENELQFSEIFMNYSKDIVPLKHGLWPTVADKEVESMYVNTAQSWAMENGFSYLSDQASIGMIISFMLNNDLDLLTEWKLFLERASYPYFNISDHNTHQSNVGIIHPNTITKQLAAIIKSFPDEIGAGSWIGTPGIVTCSIQGPVDASALGMLPVEFPELLHEEIDKDALGNDKAWEV